MSRSVFIKFSAKSGCDTLGDFRVAPGFYKERGISQYEIRGVPKNIPDADVLTMFSNTVVNIRDFENPANYIFGYSEFFKSDGSRRTLLHRRG